MSTHAKGKLRNVEVLFFDIFDTVVDYVETVTKALHQEIRSAQIADTNLLQALQEIYDWQHFTIKWREEYKSETQRLAGIGNPEKFTNGKLLWDFLLTADLLGSFKPDPEMYKKSMRLFNIQPDVDGHRACMVAAHLYDLQAAKACGMTTVFVSSRPTEDTLPQDRKPDYVDVAVADLSGLAQLIQ
ncbi:hypothetical protein NDA18_002762 [Ustilago nuda]|nr:hypothetical protein NDA18_002762 [Ustilago nuda]